MAGFRGTPVIMAAAIAKIHHLLPGVPGKKFDSFLSTMNKARVSRIAFLRHGQTGQREMGGVDFDRILTELGRQQAKEAGLRFGRELKPFFSPVLVSPAPRTVATAEIFLSAAHEDANLKPIEVLYDGAMQPKKAPSSACIPRTEKVNAH